MRCFLILFAFLLSTTWVADSVLAHNLCGLYSNNSYSNQQNYTEQQYNSKATYNNEYMPNYSQQVNSYQNIVNQGSKNQGYYATANKRTNPVRIGNPYNHLNEKYIATPAQVYSSAIKYDGDAVKFKKGIDGNLYGYNKYGKKIGVYSVNPNGTTTQLDFNGKKTIYK